MIRKSRALALAPLLLLGAQCSPTESAAQAGVRFVLETGQAARPVWVQLTTPGDQPGWIRVARGDGSPVFLRPRCEIPDCGQQPAVCGAAFPIVRDVSGAGSIELDWDGLDSVIDPVSGCESRQPAPAGSYVATFCHAAVADVEGEGDGRATGGVQGTVVEPTCADVPFDIPGTPTVTYRVPTGP